MKKFKFRLEVVLAERKRFEDQRLRDWTQVRMMLHQLVDELNSYKSRLESAIADASGISEKSGSVALMASADGYIRQLKLRIQWKERDVSRGEKLVEKARLLYVQAKQRRSALDKLKERQKQKYLENIRKIELKRIDDVYIMNGALKRRLEQEEDEGAI